MESHRWLAEIAAEIADGQAIDWPAVEARAQTDHDREVIQRLQSIERLTLAHAVWTTAQPEEPPLASWGPLSILEQVGRGTFGDVYRAWDPRLDRNVALKVLRRREATVGGDDSAIIEEARLMARLRHPNIVTVYGADRIDGRVGIWMEFVEGHTLEHEIREKGPLGAADVLAVAAALCDALGAVHQAGLLHRDLKAQNVMRASDGRILLTDFGAGREHARHPDAESVELAGTPLYLAPEVLNGAPASVCSDLYSLGVLLFHLSTGTFPLTGRTLREIRAAHEGRDAMVGQLPTPLPPATAAAIHRLLDPNPEKRPNDALQAQRALLSVPSRWFQTKLSQAAGLTLSAVLFVVLFLLMRPPQVPLEVTDAEFLGFRRVVTNWRSTVAPGNPSPDGRWMVCLDQVEGGPGASSRQRYGQLARCDFETGNVTAIGERKRLAAIPQLTSDGQRIAYVTPDRRSVRMTDVDGSNDREMISTAAFEDSKARVEYIAVSGSVLVVAAAAPNLAVHDILLVGDKTNARLLSRVSGSLAGFSLSPDGIRLAYATKSNQGRLVVRMINTQSGHDSHLAGGYAPIWTTEEDLFFLSDATGTLSFMKIRIGDRRLTLAGEFGRQGVEPLGVSQDGTMFFGLHPARWETFLAGIDFTETLVAVPAFFRSIPQPDQHAIAGDWSPDGKWLAVSSEEPAGRVYGARAKPFLTLREMSSDRQEILKLPPNTDPVFVRWSRTGLSLAVCCQRSRTGTTWSILKKSDGTLSQQFTLDGDGEMLNPSNVAISPDGTTVYYAPDAGTIRRLVLSSRVDTVILSSSDTGLGIDQQLAPGLELSADGRRLAFLSTGATSTNARVIDVSSGTITTVATFQNTLAERQHLQIGGWARGDRWLMLIYLLSPEPLDGFGAIRQQSKTWAIDVASGESISLFWAPGVISNPRINSSANRMVFSSGFIGRKPIEVWTLAAPETSGTLAGTKK